MKRLAILILVVFAASLILTNFILAGNEDDFQAIKKAVKENPKYEDGKEVKWFKVLVTDAKTKKDKVRITLPLALVEIFLKAGHKKHMNIHRDEYDIDLRELFAELKKLGPMALIEVFEDDEIVKVWLE
jgi:hypothetical protein